MIMESFATPYPLVLFDGEEDVDKGHVGIHSALSFKRFQSFVGQKVGIPATQLSLVFVCKKTSKDSDKRQKLPINENTNFSIILNHHNPSKEKDCYFLASTKKSKKERKISKKRVADNNGEDDESSFSTTDDASTGSPVSTIDWPAMHSESDGSSGESSPTKEGQSEINLDMEDCQDTTAEDNDIHSSDTEFESKKQDSSDTESECKKQEPQFQDPEKVNPSGALSRNELLRGGLVSQNFGGERNMLQQHSSYSSLANARHEEYIHDHFVTQVPQVIRPNPCMFRHSHSQGYGHPYNAGSPPQGYAHPYHVGSPPITSIHQSTPVGPRLSRAPLPTSSSMGFYPSRVPPFHNNQMPRPHAQYMHYPQRDSHVRVPPSYDAFCYNTRPSNWIPAGRVHERNVCRVCQECRIRNVNPSPFHFCPHDPILPAFRRFSPAGSIERPRRLYEA